MIFSLHRPHPSVNSVLASITSNTQLMLETGSNVNVLSSNLTWIYCIQLIKCSKMRTGLRAKVFEGATSFRITKYSCTRANRMLFVAHSEQFKRSFFHLHLMLYMS